MNAYKRYQKEHPHHHPHPHDPNQDPLDAVPSWGILSVILLLLVLGISQCVSGCPASNHNHGVQVPQQCRQWMFHVAESGPTLSLLLANQDRTPQTILTFALALHSPSTSTANNPRTWVYQHDTANMLTDQPPTQNTRLTSLSPQTVCLTLAPEDMLTDPCLEQQARQGTLCFTLGATPHE